MSLNIIKKKLVASCTRIGLLVTAITLLSFSIAFAFCTDHSAQTVSFSTVNAVDYNYTLSGTINSAAETTITTPEEEITIEIAENNNEEIDLYSQITITAFWENNADISSVSFIDAATASIIPANIDTSNHTLTIELDSSKIYADNSLSHQIKVLLPDNIASDTLNLSIYSNVSAIKNSWSETVGPISLKLHANYNRYPIKLEVADTSAHRNAYFIGNNFEPTDLVLTVTYNFGETAEITYNKSEDSYYINKGDGLGKLLLSNNDFTLSNITDLAHIQFMRDWTEGGTCSNDYESFTFTYNATADNFFVSGQIIEELLVEEDSFLELYINSGEYIITLNGSDVTDGGTGTNSDGSDTFTFMYNSIYNEYFLERQYSYCETLTWDEFLEKYVDSRNYVIVLNEKSNIPIEGTYPHAVYTESGKTVECDVPITVGNAVIQAWGEYDATDFHQYKPYATSVVFQNTYRLPDTITDGPWDVSRDNDHSVMAYMVGTDIYICSNVGTESKIIANEDSGYLFTNFTEVTSIDASNFDTTHVKTMNNMFEWCWSLETLDTTGWNTSNVTNMNSTFMQTGKNMHLDLSAWDVSNVTDMRYMFWASGSYMKTLDLTGWDVSSVQYADEMFYEQKILTNIGDTSSWNFESLIEAPEMFIYCAVLEELDVSGWDMSNLKNAKSMFRGCSALKTLDVSDWNTSNLTNATYMFSSCTQLDNIDITNWDCSSLMTNGNKQMFAYCENLTNLTIPASMRQLASQFAYHCEKLTSITFNHTADDPLTISSAGYSGPFRAIEDYDTGDDYSTTNLLTTKIYVNNDTTKSILESHKWGSERRSVTYNTVTLQLNLNGGQVIE